MGTITIKAATNIPKGLQYSESNNSPWNAARTARVVPHEGHGI